MEPDSYLVRVNFVLFTQEVAQAPVTSKAFQEALQDWADVLPIECAVFLEQPGPFPFLPFGPDSIADQRGIVRVHIADIHAPPYSQPANLLGFWDWSKNTLVLDRGVLEIDCEKAHAVALHELGHVFGLPHFLGTRSGEGRTGCYVIPDTFDARKLVMFPYMSDLNKCSKLTKLESVLAEKNLLNLQQVAQNDCFELTDH